MSINIGQILRDMIYIFDKYKFCKMIIIILAILLSGFFSIIIKNPIISVFFLVLAFFYSSIIFIYFNLEFLAFIIIIIYAGALIMLFLFVIMMLNLKIVEFYNNFYNYLPIACYISLLFYMNILFIFFNDYNSIEDINHEYYHYISLIDTRNNIYLIGELIYNFYNHLLIITSLILLISMMGSIILTMNTNINNSNLYNEVYINILDMQIYDKKI